MARRRYVHYSIERDVTPLDPGRIPGGADEPGLFVYPENRCPRPATSIFDEPWPGRHQHVLEIESSRLRIVQDNDDGSRELFLRARDFGFAEDLCGHE